ncbi:MAG TPA: cysteine-rich CWC family protein [Paucimonas sp.]|nr:cysteine-rich CWC family protein [Paucimonas sp.]HJW54388.1 cysteine-rich CWC family protein [Burkholderiaceae bacterium]
MSICPRCNALFSCGMTDGAHKEPCWCASLPALAMPGMTNNIMPGCFCPDCLDALTSASEKISDES